MSQAQTFIYHQPSYLSPFRCISQPGQWDMSVEINNSSASTKCKQNEVVLQRVGEHGSSLGHQFLWVGWDAEWHLLALPNPLPLPLAQQPPAKAQNFLVKLLAKYSHLVLMSLCTISANDYQRYRACYKENERVFLLASAVLEEANNHFHFPVSFTLV